MSLGFKLSDLGLLTNLAHGTVQNAKKACGAHSALAREVNSLHVVLTRLEAGVARPESILSGDGTDGKWKELADLVEDCERVLRVLKEILEKVGHKYPGCKHERRAWLTCDLKSNGNGEMQDLDKIRSELATYTQAITLSLNLAGLGSQGKVERYMSSHSDELREIKASLNWATAKMQVKEGSMHGEKTILSSYNGDDKEVWKLFRRELIYDGFSSKSLRIHKGMIKSYVMELGERGVLDEDVPEEVFRDGTAEDLIHNGKVVIGQNAAPQVIGPVKNDASTSPSQVVRGVEGSSSPRISPWPNTEGFTSYQSKLDSMQAQMPVKEPEPELEPSIVLTSVKEELNDSNFGWGVSNWTKKKSRRATSGNLATGILKSLTDASPEDTTTSLMPASVSTSIEPSRNKMQEDTSASPVMRKIDAFHEVKLDHTGAVLDLSFGTGGNDVKSSSGFGACRTSWNTDTLTNWDFSPATTATDTKNKTAVIDYENNPRSLNRGKPKNTHANLSFGELDGGEEEKEDPDSLKQEQKDCSDFEFISTNKKKKKQKKKRKSITFDDIAKPEEGITPIPIIKYPAKDDSRMTFHPI
ncbi:hypothetical protein N431DRAFT_461441 [Stipitochalara longipes BDJ]|nr:hypothetical protein N431DRAFT_461441 [Stipitochalara longipes BDJ]